MKFADKLNRDYMDINTYIAHITKYRELLKTNWRKDDRFTTHCHGEPTIDNLIEMLQRHKAKHGNQVVGVWNYGGECHWEVSIDTGSIGTCLSSRGEVMEP